jgi:hypothetical protein
VAGTAKSQHSVTLDFSPDFNPLTGTSRRKAEDKQQPWRMARSSYSHCLICYIYNTTNMQAGREESQANFAVDTCIRRFRIQVAADVELGQSSCARTRQQATRRKSIARRPAKAALA